MHSIVLLVLGIASILARSCTSVEVLIPDCPINEYCHSVSLRLLIPPAQAAAPAIRSGSSFITPLYQHDATSTIWSRWGHRQHRSVDPIVLPKTDSANLPMRQN